MSSCTVIVPMFDESIRIFETDMGSVGCCSASVSRSSAYCLRQGTSKYVSGVTRPSLSALEIVMTFATEPGSYASTAA